MGDDAVIIEGVDSPEVRASLNSTVHGAGTINVLHTLRQFAVAMASSIRSRIERRRKWHGGRVIKVMPRLTIAASESRKLGSLRS